MQIYLLNWHFQSPKVNHYPQLSSIMLLTMFAMTIAAIATTGAKKIVGNG